MPSDRASHWTTAGPRLECRNVGSDGGDRGYCGRCQNDARGNRARLDVRVRFNMEAATENGPPRIVYLQTDQAGLFWDRDGQGGGGGGKK